MLKSKMNRIAALKNINNNALAMFFYLYIPLFLFLFGWIKPLLSIPVFTLAFLSLAKGIQSYKIFDKQKLDSSVVDTILLFLLIVIFFVFCGHGDLMPQDGDWSKHHAILHDLVEFKWPVIYDDGSMLTYYIGQYIVPSFIGKIFHSVYIANWALVLWNSLGISIVLQFLIHYLNVKKLSSKIILLFFVLVWGGAINIGAKVYQLLGYGNTYSSYKWLDISRVRIHFAGNFDALRGAFQHVISPWVACCLFLLDKNKIENYLLIGLPLLLTSTFGFVYFAPLLLILAVWNVSAIKKRNQARKIFSFSNLALLPLLGIVIVYLVGNFLSEKPGEFGFGFLNMLNYIDFYIIFIIFEFLAYAIFIWKDNRNEVVFYLIVIELLIIPWITMGVWNDLCSRGGIPARFLLMVMCLEVIIKNKRITINKIGIIFMMIASIMNVYSASMKYLDQAKSGWENKNFIRDSYGSYNMYAGNPNVRVDDAYNYFTLDYESSLFSKVARNIVDP